MTPFAKNGLYITNPRFQGGIESWCSTRLRGQVLSFGHNGGSSVLWRYSPTSVLWQKVTTRTQPFPANGAAMAYDTHQHVLLYLANDSPNQFHNPSGKSLTFVYSSENQAWSRLPVPSPPLYGMNYLMQYVPAHRVVLHFEQAT